MTLLTGPERKRGWNDDIREQILAEAFSPCVTVADVDRRFQVSTNLIYKWRRASLMPPMGFEPAPGNVKQTRVISQRKLRPSPGQISIATQRLSVFQSGCRRGCFGLANTW